MGRVKAANGWLAGAGANEVSRVFTAMEHETRHSRVVTLRPPGARPSVHEVKRNEALACKLAELKRCDFAGECNPEFEGTGPVYFVPCETLVGSAFAQRLGIRSADDFFGGVVPHRLLGSKAILHLLAGLNPKLPAGWPAELAQTIDGLTLPGYTAVSPQNALAAAVELLKMGDVRVKDPFASGGHRQAVVRSVEELDCALRSLLPSVDSSYVLELNLDPVTMFTVGQVQVDPLTIAYYGTQRTTHDSLGAIAYGGTDLVVTRGTFEQLLHYASVLPDDIRLAIRQAVEVDANLIQCPDVLASRRNYDVAQGYDSHGVFRSGVVDQSWRIGGCSGVEVAALEAFALRTDLQLLRGSAYNRYGRGELPRDAIVHFDGVDTDFGPMQVYTIIEELAGIQ